MKPNEIKEITTLSNYPAWKKENDKLIDLQTRDKVLKERIRDLLSTRVMDMSKRRDIFEEEAQALIDGKPASLVVVSAVEADIETANHEHRVLQKAISMQEKRVRKEQGEASVKACNKLKPEYARHINKIAKALLVLESAARAERSLRMTIDSSGFSFLMRPMSLKHIGYIDAEYGSSYICGWLKEADEYGLIDKKKLLKTTDSKEWTEKDMRIDKPTNHYPYFMPVKSNLQMKAINAVKKISL